jgi:16S rRNA C1402 (ribose-2'-O) methylase RsmI
VLRGSLSELLEQLGEGQLKGEYTVVIAGADDK